ncbi:UvrD-helicase domain-containing protein [Alloscardovia criceti]|uniref:UvrD-helicase domain-containing protein n=1 Tax=Alloscardovia criceti TaxID=356828 RepID=UPI0003715C30|nr:UvrD-helicase domain-containing protein [Alloscardovia criceti]
MTEFTLTDEQSHIVDADADASMLIVAGAGSGKTFTMTQRIIRLISEGVPPEKILGLTFTKAAATELLTRVSTAVQKHRDEAAQKHKGELDSESLESHADSAFMKPDVYTYDAFFQSIVRQFGLLVGMNPQTVPLSEAGAYQLVDTVIQENFRQVVADLYGDEEEAEESDSSQSEGSTDSLDDFSDLGAYSTIVTRVLSLSDAISSSMIDGSCTSVDEAIRRIETWDDAFIQHLTQIMDREYPEEQTLEGFGDKVDIGKFTTAKTFDNWMKKKSRDYFAYMLTDLRDKTRKRSMYLKYVRLFAQKKRELHMAQFADFTIAAMQLIQRFPWIGEHYRARFSHVFLDEYQDSSTTQASLIVQLFAPHGVNAQGQHSALTAVGDPYQAIYGWRGAAPGAFAAFVQKTGVGTPLSLSKTVRNPQLVLDMANMLTNPLRMGHKDAYDRPGTIALQERPVEKLSVLAQSIQGSFGAMFYASMKQEIDGIVRYALKAVDKSKADNDARIKRGESAQQGPYVAVLLRSKTRIDAYVDGLTKAGLTVQVDGVQTVMDRPDAHDIINLLRIVADHSDSASVLNLLASTRYDLAASDLKALSVAAKSYDKQLQTNLLKHVNVQDTDTAKDWDMPAVVSLADILLADNRAEILRTYFTGSAEGAAKINDFAQAVQRVESQLHSGIEAVIRTAGDVLGLDIDVAVAYALSRAQGRTGEAVPVSSVESIAQMARTYNDELLDGQTATVSGFLSWLDGQKKSLPENPTIVGAQGADVIVCTIHHSKGLEWDSVIIPSMNKSTFPSSQGSYFSTDELYKDDPEPRFGRYLSHAHTWLTDPTAVPYPVRSDKDSVSRFVDVEDFPKKIGDSAALEKLVYGQIHLLERGELSSTMSIREESGQTVLEDERRLAYVAVTRAKRDVLITGFTQTMNAMTDDDDPVGYVLSLDAIPAGQKLVTADVSKASLFWQECYDFMTTEQSNTHPWKEDVISVGDFEIAQNYQDSPVGAFVGQDAQDYAQTVIGEALTDAQTAVQDAHLELYAHPREVEPVVGRVLQKSYETLRTFEQQQTPDSEHNAAQAEETVAPSLYECARQLHETLQQLHATSSADDADQKIVASAQRVLSQRNTSVTALQRERIEASEAGQDRTHHSETQLRRARAIMRPVPSLVLYEDAQELSPATLGTKFHAFAERYFSPEDERADGSFAELKQSMRAEVEREEPQNAVEKQMHVWKQRLLDSPFSVDDSVGTEIPFAYAIEGEERAVVGVIDAVFAGNILTDSPISQQAQKNQRQIRYTVIDWKTGHRPRKAEEIEQKLLQIDMYREILAHIKHVEVDEVDAALYYVSEENAEERTIYAQYKTAADIEQLFHASVWDFDADRNE